MKTIKQKVSSIFICILVFFALFSSVVQAAGFSWSGKPMAGGLNSLGQTTTSVTTNFKIVNKITSNPYNEPIDIDLRLLKSVWWGLETVQTVKQYSTNYSTTLQAPAGTYRMFFKANNGGSYWMEGSLTH